MALGGGRRVLPCFRIEQHRTHSRREIAAHTAAVVGEHVGHAIDVRGRWVARDQRPDQPGGDKRRHVRVREDVLHYRVVILLRRLVRGHREAEEQRLGALVVIVVAWLQRAGEVFPVGADGARPDIGPTRKRARDVVNARLVIGGDRIAGAIELRPAVLVHEVEADGEELHHFPRVVFIRTRYDTVAEIEILAHRRIQRHLAQQVLEIAQRVVGDRREPGQHFVAVRILISGHDEDLRERENHPLPHLIRAGRHIVVPTGAQRVEIAGRRQWRGRQCQLLRQPRGCADLFHSRDIVGRRAERRLLEEARCRKGRGVGRGRRRRAPAGNRHRRVDRRVDVAGVHHFERQRARDACISAGRQLFERDIRCWQRGAIHPYRGAGVKAVAVDRQRVRPDPERGGRDAVDPRNRQAYRDQRIRREDGRGGRGCRDGDGVARRHSSGRRVQSGAVDGAHCRIAPRHPVNRPCDGGSHGGGVDLQDERTGAADGNRVGRRRDCQRGGQYMRDQAQCAAQTHDATPKKMHRYLPECCQLLGAQQCKCRRMTASLSAEPSPRRLPSARKARTRG